MDANEVNKIAGALFGMLTLAVGVGLLSGALVHQKPAKKAGYELPDAVASSTAGGAAAAATAEPIAKRLAAANVQKGEAASNML